MSERNLVREGFAAVARRPEVVAGEIAWRWAFGAAAWVLLLVGVHLVFRAVPVSRAEIAMARRYGVFQAADAIARILIDAWPGLLRLAAVLVPGIAAVWILAASVGRAATLKGLLNGVRSEKVEAGRPRPATVGFRSLLGLNFLRAGATLAAIIGYIGALVLAGMTLPSDPQYAGIAVLVWMLLAGAVALCWTVLNWFLALAAIFVARDGDSAFAAVAASLALYRRQPRDYATTAAWFGFFRSLALVAAIVLSLFAAAAPTGVATAVIVAAVALAYFAVADWMYVARLAAFVKLAEPPVVPAPAEPPVPESPPAVESHDASEWHPA